MLGFTIDSESLTIRLPAAKIAGARALSDQLQEKAHCKAMDVNAIQQLRGEVGHFC